MLPSVRTSTFFLALSLCLFIPVSTAESGSQEFIVPFSEVYPSDNSTDGWLDSLVVRYSSNALRAKYYYPRQVLLLLFQLGDPSPDGDDLILIAFDREFDRSESPGGDDVLFLVKREGSSRSYGGWSDTWREGAASYSWSYRVAELGSSYAVFMEISIGEVSSGQRIGFAVGQLNGHEVIDYPPGSNDGHPASWGVLRFIDLRVVEEVPGEERVCRISESLIRICYY